jgi:hypothetical protein
MLVCVVRCRAYADSKTLTHAQREALFKQVQADEQLAYASDSLSAAFISGQMLARAKVSLNAIAADSTMGLIRQSIEAGVNLREVSSLGLVSLDESALLGMLLCLKAANAASSLNAYQRPVGPTIACYALHGIVCVHVQIIGTNSCCDKHLQAPYQGAY